MTKEEFIQVSLYILKKHVPFLTPQALAEYLSMSDDELLAFFEEQKQLDADKLTAQKADIEAQLDNLA
jgi:hypothetical protein